MSPLNQQNEFSGTFNNFDAPFLVGAQLSTAGGSIIIGSHADDNRLPLAAEALFNSLQRQHDPTCLPNTRVNLLNEIRAWADGQQAKCLWLSGMAGTGKSTIARTVAREYMDMHRLGATFFFSKGGGDAGNASKFFVTIAAQLAQHSPALKRNVYDAVNANVSIIKQGLHDQWRQLVVQPLARLDAGALRQPLLLIVDALDECDSESDIELIVELLARAHETKSVPLRVLLTSRPELPVRNGFAHVVPAAHQDVVLHAISSHIVARDLTVFLRHRLGEVQRQWYLPATWPGEYAIQTLLQMTGGLFIWADTACRFIRDGRQFADERLSAILAGRGVMTAPEQKLDSIYNSILRQVIIDQFSDVEKESACAVLRRVLAALALLFSPLPIPSMAELLALRKVAILQALDGMRSVIDVSDHRGAVTLHHPSFRDFLLNPRRCADIRIQVKAGDCHRELAEHCLRAMAGSLKTDICELRRPGALAAHISHDVIDRCLPAHVRYACLNWVSHYKQAGVRIIAEGPVHAFLKVHFLHWLEVLSLLSRVPDGVLWAKDLEDMLEREDEVAAFVHDAVRFLQSFRAVIELAPLQTYASALVFAPETCRIRHAFRMTMPGWTSRLPDVPYRWTSLLQELEGHKGMVTTLTFSPDGQVLASASEDNTVRLWSSRTGALRSTLVGHSRPVSAMAFSPDGSLLATAALDGLVKLWRSSSGTVQLVLRTLSATVGSVAFSPDGRALTIGDMGSIRVWDMLRETFSSFPFDEDLNMALVVSDLKFSPNGRLFVYHFTLTEGIPAIGSVVCRHVTGSATFGMRAHRQDTGCASAFSPDSQYLAVAHYDNLSVYQSETGELLHVFESIQGFSLPTPLSFSPDGSNLACGTTSGVLLFDVNSLSLGGRLRLLEDESRVQDVKYSSAGMLLASSSHRTIKFWHPHPDSHLSTSEYTPRRVNCVDLSNDGHYFAVSDNKGTSIRYLGLEASSQYAGADSVSLSSDGQYMALILPPSTLQVWNTRSGTSVFSVRCRHVSQMVFSPCDDFLAVGFEDGYVDVRVSTTGDQRYELNGHEGRVTALAFSPNGADLASAAAPDNTINIWQLRTGQRCCTLSGHALPVRSLSFPSADEEHVVSASDDQTVRVWHMPTSDMVQIFPLSAFPGSVCLDANGAILAASYRGSLRHALADRVLAGGEAQQPRHAAVVGEWLVWGSERLLWLPPQYRPSSLAFSGELIALGCASGQRVIIGLDPRQIETLLAV